MSCQRQALGLQPKKRKVAQQPQLSPAELAELMRKARGEDEDEPAAPGEEADRVKGLGFRPCGSSTPDILWPLRTCFAVWSLGLLFYYRDALILVTTVTH